MISRQKKEDATLPRMVRSNAIVASVLAVTNSAYASVYDGDGISQGVSGVGGGSQSLWDFIRNTLFVVLSYVALASVVMIVIAGIMMIVSAGNDELVQKAKKIIIWVIVGIIVILISSAIVYFIINLTSPNPVIV